MKQEPFDLELSKGLEKEFGLNIELEGDLTPEEHKVIQERVQGFLMKKVNPYKQIAQQKKIDKRRAKKKFNKKFNR